MNDNADIVKLLLASGANVNLINEDGNTPLDIACNYPDIVKMLEEHERENQEQLIDACCKGNTEIVEELVNNGVDINTVDTDGDTPLHEACFGGHVNVIKLLLGNKADINIANKDGNTPLHLASFNGNKEIRNLLEEHIQNQERK
jgi:serine/threonine-protein phosphatase 6 regulatory ankyrin repeat subunit B